jgi:ketosteroid isomerase-like protein
VDESPARQPPGRRRYNKKGVGRMPALRYMTNKEIIQKVNEAFAAGDTDTILSFVDDDVRWDVLGFSTAIGREEFRREVENEGFEGRPVITITSAIEEGDRVAVEGRVLTKPAGGEPVELVFHNAYRLENGKIKEMRSYLVFPK